MKETKAFPIRSHTVSLVFLTACIARSTDVLPRRYFYIFLASLKNAFAKQMFVLTLSNQTFTLSIPNFNS
jgi:hypothetical protein